MNKPELFDLAKFLLGRFPRLARCSSHQEVQRSPRQRHMERDPSLLPLFACTASLVFAIGAGSAQEPPKENKGQKAVELRVIDLTSEVISYWSKDPKIAWKCINARGETVNTTPAFRDAYKARRCLVPADAFYEWKANGRTKQPYAIAMRERHPFAFAGLWENWKDPTSDEWVRTFTILTTKPNEVIAPLHDRMPVILAPVDYDRWLDTDSDPASLIRPHPIDEMVTWPVSTRVNKPENDDPAILDRADLSA